MAADDDAADDLIFLALLVSGFFVGVRLMRNLQAARSTEYFAPTPPRNFSFNSQAPSPTGPILDVLAPMRLSPAGAAFIKGQEGWTATAKADAGGRSIGYGHFIQAGENIPATITRAQGEALFLQDVAAAENAVNNGLMVSVDQNQFDALVDFAFNEGAAAFAKSELLEDLNAGNFGDVSAELNRWIYSQGNISTALKNRRKAEANLFFS